MMLPWSFHFLQSVYFLVFCPWFLPWTMALIIFSIQVLILPRNLWISLVWPLKPADVTLLSRLLNADTSPSPARQIILCTVLVVFGLMLSSHFTKWATCHQKDSINVWMETFKFLIISRKTILQACPDGESLVSNHLCFSRISHEDCHLFNWSASSHWGINAWLIYFPNNCYQLCSVDLPPPPFLRVVFQFHYLSTLSTIKKA